MKDANILWFRNTLLERTARALKANGFRVEIATGVADARQMLLKEISPSETVGVGGSMTIEEIGIIPELLNRGIKVVTHTSGKEPAERLELRYQAVGASVYLSSPNAVTLDGKLLFIDHYGNRPAGMTFGPKKVIAVAGVNKITPDEETGWWRAKNVAAVINARRLGLKTPCTVVGYCSDCDSPERICRVFLKLEKKPKSTDYLIILVNEDLGY